MLPMSIYVVRVFTRKKPSRYNHKRGLWKKDKGEIKSSSLLLRDATCVRFRLEIILSMFALIRAYCFVS